jgi:hypothetical protein
MNVLIRGQAILIFGYIHIDVSVMNIWIVDFVEEWVMISSRATDLEKI